MTAPEPPSSAALDGVSWQASYDRESVDRYLAEAEAERIRLQAELDDAEARLAAAQHRRNEREAEARAALAALVRVAQATIARLEAEHEGLVDAVRAVAADEAARLVAAASAEASAPESRALDALEAFR